ncbi:hypothetical protein DFH09DRAFT_1105081 [Mycena vulgaris]|nr:hypothetical protein DFH09DRAFT_1105081 [Mycena vulgaris]
MCATATGARPAPRGAGKRESRAAPTHGRWSPVPAYTPERPTATWMSHALARVYVGGVRAAPGAAAPGRQSTLCIVTASGTSGGTRARETGADGNAPGATSGTRCARYGRRRAGAYEGMQRREGGRLVDEGAPRKRCEGCATPTPARGAPGEDAALSEALAMRAGATTTPLRTRARGVAVSGPVKLQCAAVIHSVYYSNGRAGARGVSREKGRWIGIERAEGYARRVSSLDGDVRSARGGACMQYCTRDMCSWECRG